MTLISAIYIQTPTQKLSKYGYEVEVIRHTHGQIHERIQKRVYISPPVHVHRLESTKVQLS